MMPWIHVQPHQGSERSQAVDGLPEQCPYCGHKIHAMERHGEIVTYGDEFQEPSMAYLWAVFQCPVDDCQRLFLATYEDRGGGNDPWLFGRTIPTSCIKREFDDHIRAVSQKFCAIWQQASEAEQAGLTEICGPGYRKALEFLIKDYLSFRNPDDAEKYQRTALRNCIEHHVSDPNVKTCATRAAILGNDETHYLRDWTDKDVGDLQALIELTLYWISAEHVMESYKTSMPDKP